MRKTSKGKAADPRINAPLISGKSYLIILAVLYFIVLGQAFIVAEWLDETLTMAGVLAYYLAFTGLVVSLLVGVFRRYILGKPIRRLADAARQVAAGDFTVRVQPIRKDGKKDEVEVLIEDFNTMVQELNSTELLKSDFLSTISHEIKTPLAVIQSYAKAVKDPAFSQQQREAYADTIIEAAQKLNAMIGNILRLNRLEHQSIPPRPEDFPLGEQLRRCALAFLDQWQAKGIDFQIDVADVTLRADPALLELVWNNLLSNAIKFTPSGGRIRLTSQAEEDAVAVSVEDTGCGMDEKTLGHIFEKFYQGDPSRATEGNGLGLALVKKVLDLAGSTIQVTSRLGEGTRFTVTLPR